MKRHSPLIFVTICLACTVEAGVLYDLKADFGTVSNPHGAWSYELDGNLLTLTRSDAQLSGWDPGGNWDSSVAQIIGSTAGWNDGQIGDIVMHSPVNDVYNRVIWTSPGPGTVDLSGRVWDALHEAGRDSSWTLSLNTAPISFRSTVVGILRGDNEALFVYNQPLGYTLTGLTVAAGDTVSVATRKDPSSVFGHLLGVELTVDFTPVPEPHAAGLAILALAFCSTIHRRKRAV